MIRLLIIADDLTGALDTGVKFAAYGSDSRVVFDINYDFSQCNLSAKVLVIDTETRHLNAETAYDMVYNTVKRAVTAGIQCVFKKTDSALRGNIGSELTATLKGSGKKFIPFLPAFPKMGRTTIHGVQYIEGIPIHESIFGHDPFEPVLHSYIPDIIKQQSEVPVKVLTLKEYLDVNSANGICVFDSKSETDLYRIAIRLKKRGSLTVMGGCAGLAGILPQVLDIKRHSSSPPLLSRPLVVLCGSVNEISKRQLAYAERHGFARVTLTPEQMLDPSFFITAKGKELIHSWQAICRGGSSLIIDTIDKTEAIDHGRNMDFSPNRARISVAKTLGKVLRMMVDAGVNSQLFVIGGDTLNGFMQEVCCQEIIPLYEFETGVVYSEFPYNRKTLNILSKSGGFGDEQLIARLWEKMK
jgi:D-threonate/D-erythronate kinase